MTDEEWESGLPADHSIDVTVTDNPVIARVYGPRGEVLAEVHERPTTFGFARWRERGSE